MYQTIQVSTCVSAQGELVESLPNGEAIVRDGDNVYRGRPIVRRGATTAAEGPVPATMRVSEDA